MSDFESWFSQGEPADQQNQPNQSSDFASWMTGAGSDQRLGFSMQKARQENPDMRAEVFRLQGKTGLPAQLIQRNIEKVRQAAAQKDFDPKAYRRDFPRLAGLMEDPDNAALSSDDQEALQALERTLQNDRFADMGTLEWIREAPAAAFREGRMAEQRNNLAFRQFMGDDRPELEGQLADIEAKLGGDFGAGNFLSQALIDATQFLPSTVGALFAGAETGATGALAGAGTALAAGQLGPQIAAPEEIFTVPGAAALGFAAGSRVGAAKYSFEQEAGAAYREFSQFRDNDGVLMDQGTARVAATVSASLNSGLEVLGLESLVQSFPGGAKALQGVGRQSIKEALRNPGVREAFSNIAKRFGATWSVQTATEVAQEAVTIIAGEAAKGLSEQDFEGMSGDEFRDRLTETFKQAVSGTALLSLPGPTAGFARDLGRARNARNTREKIEAIGEHARASKLRERMPEKYREFVAKIKEGGDTDNIYIPVERFNQAFEAAGLDPREVANEVNGNYDAYTEALASGGDIVIPLERYAEKLAGGDYHQQLMDDVRFRPDDMTAREAREFERDAPDIIDQIMGDQQPDPSQAVYDDQLGQLIAAGRDRSAAESEATLMQSVFRSLGERTGQDPAELYKSLNIGVRRPLPDILTQRRDTDTALDPLIDRLRSGDIPTDRDAFGPSLMDFLREHGIRDDGGELSARGLDSNRRAFQRGLIRDDGLGLDEAAQLAAEYRYLGGDSQMATPDMLLDALDRENRDAPVFADDRGDSQIQELSDQLGQLSSYLDELGIDLSTADNQQVRDALNGVQSNAGRDAEGGAMDGATTLQQNEGQPRGQISFNSDRTRFDISLFDRANLSTYLHETGHLYLEVVGELAQREDAPQQIRDDFQTIIDWLGVESRDDIKTDHHEQFARGFEAYLREGNAPSAGLRQAFARFRAWLTSVYRSMKELRVDLSPEVRGVFDRLVATDEEINDARTQSGHDPIFADAESAGMTAGEYQQYRKMAEKARDEAEESLTAKAMQEYQRERKRWWRDAKAGVRQEVEAEVNQRPVYTALSILGRGKMPDGSPLPYNMEPIKLNRAALVEMYGAEYIKRLPRPYVYSREGGVHPDMAAEFFGYRSGDEMIKEMIDARPRRKLIEAETDRRMSETYGDMLTDGSMTDAALTAVHNETRASVIDQEYRHLAKQAGGSYGSRRQVIKAAAQRMIAEKQIRDIRPGQYLQAERKNGRDAFRMLAGGDYRGAALAKQRQMLNHYLYREAQTAKSDVESALRYFKRFDKKTTRQTIAKAGSDYLEQIDAILSRYELKRIPLRQIDRRASLGQWIAEQQANGFDIDAPESVLNDSRTVNYQQVPLEELRGMRDAIKQIEHLARLKDKLLSEQYKRTMQETADDIVASISANHTMRSEPINLAPDWRDRFIDGAKSYHAWHMKPEFITKWLDGHKNNGAAWRAIFKPLADAEDAEAVMQAKASADLNSIMSRYTKQERARWFVDKVHVDEVGQTFNKASLMSVALNWGNEYNRQVLMEGHGWNQSQVEAVLSRLDQRDWETVQALWDMIDGFWPEIQKMERDLNGLTPEKVQSSPVTTPYGEFKGGYYPIKHDSRAAHKTWVREQKAGESLFENSYSKPATRQGHTKERQGSNGQRLRLDLNVLSEHISQITHDLTHRRAIVDVDRLLQREDVREAIENTAGRDIYRQFRPWLSAIANEVQQPEHLWEKLIGQARAGATVVNMGMKITTAIVQPLGYLQSIDMIGGKYAWKGLQMFLGGTGREGYERGMKKAVQYVHERSVMMSNRQRTFDRDVRDTINRSLGRQRTTSAGQAVGRVLDPIQETAFYLTGMMDLATSVPTWLGAYQKALDGMIDGVDGGDEKGAAAHADAMVRQSQSAGGTKDLAAIQRGPQLRRALTMFYSYFSVLYNIGAERTSQLKRGDISIPRAAASAFFLWFAPSVLGELVAGRGPDDDEEWGMWAAKNAIGYPAGAVIGLRDVVNAALTPFGYDASPAFDAFASTAKTVQIPFKALDDDQELGRSDVKNALMTAGYWGKLPARQAWITGEYLYDVATGEDEPESPQEFVRNLFFSRPADQR